MLFCLGVFTKAGICSPAWARAACSSCSQVCQHPAELLSPHTHSPVLVAMAFTARLAQPQSHSSCPASPFEFPLPAHTSSHQSAPVPLRVLLSPPCLPSASPQHQPSLAGRQLEMQGASGMGVSITGRALRELCAHSGEGWAGGRDPPALKGEE